MKAAHHGSHWNAKPFGSFTIGTILQVDQRDSLAKYIGERLQLATNRRQKRPGAGVRGRKPGRAGPGGRIARESLENPPFSATAPPARDEDVEEDLESPGAQVRAKLVPVGE